MGLLDEIGAQLTVAGVASSGASSTGWALRYRGLTPQPVRQVAVIPSGGFAQEGIAPIDRPTFQVLVRGSSDMGRDLEDKVDDVDSALNLVEGVVGGRVYVDIQRQGDKAFLGLDEHQCPLYSLNYLALRSRTT